jgi:hypothetical protein
MTEEGPVTDIFHLPPRTSITDIGNFVAHLRRVVRKTIAAKDWSFAEAQRNRAEAQALKDRGNPFDAARISKQEQRAHELDARGRALSENIRRYGCLLTEAASCIDMCTTLAERCELLNVNIADRTVLTDGDGVVTILFAHALEDSAERRHCEFNDGPLFTAMRLVMMDLLDTPQGQAASHALYEPGGMFEWLPFYTRNPDGTWTRLPPPLREFTRGSQAAPLHGSVGTPSVLSGPGLCNTRE